MVSETKKNAPKLHFWKKVSPHVTIISILIHFPANGPLKRSIHLKSRRSLPLYLKSYYQSRKNFYELDTKKNENLTRTHFSRSLQKTGFRVLKRTLISSKTPKVAAGFARLRESSPRCARYNNKSRYRGADAKIPCVDLECKVLASLCTQNSLYGWRPLPWPHHLSLWKSIRVF